MFYTDQYFSFHSLTIKGTQESPPVLQLPKIQVFKNKRNFLGIQRDSWFLQNFLCIFQQIGCTQNINLYKTEEKILLTELEALVNAYFGMAVDLENNRPLLLGGLSGPAIKPLALRAVWEVHDKISIPIIGIGGIMTGEDVTEFMLCGASAVQIGTANLVDPDAYNKILLEYQRISRLRSKS